MIFTQKLLFIKKFWRIPANEKILLIKGTYFIFLYKLLVVLMPLKYYIFLLRPKKQGICLVDNMKMKMKIVKKTISRATEFIPGTTNCIVKALAYKKLLNSYGIQSEIVLTLNKKLNTHHIPHAYVAYKDTPIFLYRKDLDQIYIPY